MELKVNKSEKQFLDWAKENDVYYHPSLNLFAMFENGLRGVETRSNIDKVFMKSMNLIF